MIFLQNWYGNPCVYFENLKKLHEQFVDSKIILIHGADWKNIPGSNYIKKIGGEIIQLPYYEKLSQKRILEKLGKTLIGFSIDTQSEIKLHLMNGG